MAEALDTYLTIEHSAKSELKEKGSRFIALLYPINTPEQAMEIVSNVRKEYYDATHHCFAYIIGKEKNIFRQNDDGEPSYTAGKPIYNALMSKDLTNVLCVVVRYFGGVKLGVGGLIKAYRSVADLAIDNAPIIEKQVLCCYRVSFSYEKMNDVMKILKNFSLKPFNNSFSQSCNLNFEIRKSLYRDVLNKFDIVEGVKIDFIGEK
jgi:uncharacterized protein, YigZ family